MPEIELSWPFDNVVSRELGPGSRLQDDLRAYRMKLRLADEAVLVDLRDLYKAARDQTPPELQRFFRSKDAYIVRHTIQVRDEGAPYVKQIGYEVEYPEDLKVRIEETIPDTQYVTSWRPGLQGLAPWVELALGPEARLLYDWLRSGGGAVGEQSHRQEPLITARGVGSHRGDWVLKSLDRPFAGDFHLFHVITRGTTSLQPLLESTCQVRVWANALPLPFEILRSSKGPLPLPFRLAR